jgi:hypothetical protein
MLHLLLLTNKTRKLHQLLVHIRVKGSDKRSQKRIFFLCFVGTDNSYLHRHEKLKISSYQPSKRQDASLILHEPSESLLHILQVHAAQFRIFVLR